MCRVYQFPPYCNKIYSFLRFTHDEHVLKQSSILKKQSSLACFADYKCPKLINDDPLTPTKLVQVCSCVAFHNGMLGAAEVRTDGSYVIYINRNFSHSWFTKFSYQWVPHERASGARSSPSITLLSFSSTKSLTGIILSLVQKRILYPTSPLIR